MSVYLIPPSPLDLYLHKSPKLTCLVVDLASDDSVTLQWSRESRGLVKDTTWNSKLQFNMTYTITSTLPVEADDWIEGETYECRLSHPHLPKDIVRTISKGNGQSRAGGWGGPLLEPGLTPHLFTGKRVVPEVYVFLPPEEERGTKDTLTLTCLIQNFFPADISVQWLCNNSLIPTDKQVTTWPLKANSSSRTFFVFSRLEVSRADWEKRSQFTCRVVHEALSGSRTLEKSVSKAPGN